MYTIRKQESMRAFAAAATICGILSLALACCGLSIPFAAAGLLFTVLAERRVGPKDNMLIVSKIFCIAGLMIGVFTIAYIISQINNPAFMEQINATCQALYGMDFEELMQYYQY